MERGLISIIVPIYNVEQYLPRCLDSILAQTYTNFEVILVDDGALDNSGKICDEYITKDKRVKIIHQQNRGVSAARNSGLRIANGEYIGFIDADDYIKKDMFEYLISLIKNNFVDIAVCNYCEFNNNIIRNNIIKEDLTIVDSSEALLLIFFSLSFSCCNKLFRQELFNNEFFKIDISMGEDLDIVFRLFSKSKKICIGNEIKYYYNKSNLQSSTKQVFSIKYLSVFKVFSEILKQTVLMPDKKIHKMILNTRINSSVEFLKQIIISNIKTKEIILHLQQILHHNILSYMKSKYKLSNKFFALAVYINFNLTQIIYKIIYKNRK